MQMARWIARWPSVRPRTTSATASQGLLLRTDGSLLVGDDTGIYALLGDSALQTFGVDGAAMNAEFKISSSGTNCLGLQSFAADQSGKLLTVSAVNLRDGEFGFELRRLNENGTEIAGSVQRTTGAAQQGLFKTTSDSPTQRSRSICLPKWHVRFRLARMVGCTYFLASIGTTRRLTQIVATAGRLPDLLPMDTLDTGWGDGGVVVLEKGGLGYWDSIPTLLEPLADGRVVALTPNGVLTRLLGGSTGGSRRHQCRLRPRCRRRRGSDLD